MSDWVSMLCGLGEMTPLEEVLPNGSSSGLLLHMDGKSFAFEGEPGGTVELNDDRGVSVFTDYNGDGLIDSVATVLFSGDCYTVECAPGDASTEQWGLNPMGALGVGERGDPSWVLVEQITPVGVANHWWGL